MKQKDSLKAAKAQTYPDEGAKSGPSAKFLELLGSILFNGDE